MADDTSLRVESLSEELDDGGDEALATRSDEARTTRIHGQITRIYGKIYWG